jgi:DNA-binding beta-propeller fold protein YncE
VLSVPLTGGAATILCSASGFGYEMGDMVVSGGNVYFTNPYGGGGISVCSTSTTGATAATYYADTSDPMGLATDGTNLYWTEDESSGSILKCALGTSCATPTTLVSGTPSPNGIAVNATQIFWTGGDFGTQSVYVFHN